MIADDGYRSVRVLVWVPRSGTSVLLSMVTMAL